MVILNTMFSMLSFIGCCCIFMILFNIRIVKLADTIRTNNDTIFENVSETTETWTTAKPAESKIQTTKYSSLKMYHWDVFCKFQANSYDCANDYTGVPKFYYDTKMQDCKTFQYGKCHENSMNVFDTLSHCHEVCRDPGVAPVIHNFPPNIYCRFQQDFGTCTDYQPMFYYDISKQKCVGFAFSGCGGNQNRFSSFEACQTVCTLSVSQA